jgi:dUTP pyrophosphatase
MKDKVRVRIINKSRHLLPAYQTAGAAALDITANLDAPVVLGPLERRLVPTGLYMAIPEGHEAQIRPRSGLAVKHGITMVNSPGTIDSDYRGELMIILINMSNEAFTIQDGERIAQMVVAPVSQVEWDEVETHDETERGSGGFGHTGK